MVECCYAVSYAMLLKLIVIFAVFQVGLRAECHCAKCRGACSLPMVAFNISFRIPFLLSDRMLKNFLPP
jgi:hypothetical protein